MNEKIKEILAKNHLSNLANENIFKNAIIEICELQKEECASKVIDHYKQFITNSKNIAE